MAITNSFVRTKVIEQKEILTLKDNSFSNNALVSIKPDSCNKRVTLTIGARLAHQDRACFSKSYLKELIEALTEVHNQLEDY